MTKTTGIAILSAAALLGPAAANAAESTLPWTFAEFGYTRWDGYDANDSFFGKAEPDAYSLLGSIGFAGKWHAQLEWTDGEVDSNLSDDPDFDGYRIVLGAHPQITDNTQLRVDVTYYDYDGGEGSTDIKTDGYGIGFGLRHAFSPKFEGTAQVWYVEGTYKETGFSTFKEDYNDTVLEFQGRYNWTDYLSTGLTYTLDGGPIGSAFSSVYGNSGDSIRFDVRWSFGYNTFSDVRQPF